jgi:uncharacterized membrane protein YsdA (DUF1294 family)
VRTGSSKRTLIARIVIAALVAGVLVAGGLVVMTELSAGVAWVVGFGLITFLTYGYDKLRAVRHGRRVPNLALQLLSVFGGAGGGWAGMVVWRHKVNHATFWLAQIVGTVAIVAAFWLL